MLKEDNFIPEGIKKEHIKQIQCGMRKTIKDAALVHPSSLAYGIVYPDSEVLINSLQASTIGPYLPPGPTYNEREKRYSLTVMNTIAGFSVDECVMKVKDIMFEMLEDKKAALKERKKVAQETIEKELAVLKGTEPEKANFKILRGYFRNSKVIMKAYISTVNSEDKNV